MLPHLITVQKHFIIFMRFIENYILTLFLTGYREIAGHRIELSEIRLIFKSDNLTTGQYEVHSDNDVLVLLDVTPDSSMQDEGTAREIINRIQKLRKKAHLVPTDEICVFYAATDDLERVAESLASFIESTIKTGFKKFKTRTPSDQLIIEENQQVKNGNLYLALTKYSNVNVPVVRWTNVQLVDLSSHYCDGATKGVVLLEAAGKQINLQVKNKSD